jgi:acyl-CoA synthetase (AMP-forming)/AMP-acid ligase II
VSEVVVRGEMTTGGELLAAYVESTSVQREAIVEHCRHSLAEYKLPQRIIIRAKLPRSSAGKVAAARLTDEPPTR